MVVHNDTSSALSVTLPSDREIVLRRVFNAPRELVFEALSKPGHLARWWGLRNMTLPVCELDFRPGGAWRFVSRDRDGNEFAFHGEIREIVPPERVVQTFEYEGMPGHVSVETLTLEELKEEQHQDRAGGTKTRLTIRSLFDSVEDRDGMLQSGMESGAAESYDRLAEFLEALA